MAVCDNLIDDFFYASHDAALVCGGGGLQQYRAFFLFDK